MVVQFRHTLPSAKAGKAGKPPKTDMGNQKTDQVWIRYTGKTEDFNFKTDAEGCLNKVNLGALKYDWGMDAEDPGEPENWSQCAAWSYNIS